MNCHDAEVLLSAERDGELDDLQHAALERHVAECAACRQARAVLDMAAQGWRETACAVEVPDAGGEWRVLQAQIAGAGARSRQRARPWWMPGWRLAPVLLGAACAAVLLLRSGNPVQTAPSHVAAAPRPAARADYVDVADAQATPVVYVDADSGWLIVWAEHDSL